MSEWSVTGNVPVTISNDNLATSLSHLSNQIYTSVIIQCPIPAASINPSKREKKKYNGERLRKGDKLVLIEELEGQHDRPAYTSRIEQGR